MPLLLPPCADPGVWLALPADADDDTDAGTDTAETFDHCALAFVAASSCVYGTKLKLPSLASCTMLVTPAKYCAPASPFVVGPGRVAVVLDSTLMTYVAEPSSGMNANSCWTPAPEGWKSETAWPCVWGNNVDEELVG